MNDGAAKIWGQLVVGLLSNFKSRILGWWFIKEKGKELELEEKQHYKAYCLLQRVQQL